MNKEELFQELSRKISMGEVSRGEIVSRFNLATETTANAGGNVGANVGGGTPKAPSNFSATKMLYVLGAAVVLIGIIIFVHQIWDDIGSFGRILVTLGLGLLVTAIGSMLLKSKPEENIGSIFHFIGGMLIPGGAVVTLSEMEIVDLDWPMAIVFAGIFVFYLLLNYVHKNAVLTFFAIANGTATIYLFLGAIIGSSGDGFGGIENIYEYTTMAIGASYLLLAYAFRSGWNKQLIGSLYFFGSAGFLGAAFSQVFDSVGWQMLYFLIVIGGIFLSAYMRSRSILVMSTLFLVAHVSYITSEYFADSIGWPISLVALGFVFIGLGYASITINKRYIA